MFRNKEYILTIWQEGNFSKAAQRLYISQPSLSATVKRIETAIGTPIFDRSTTPISLTEIGEEYVRYALEIEGKEQEFKQYLSDYTQLLTGSVRIGGSSLFASLLLPRMIAEFTKKYPQISFEISEDHTKNLMEKLSRGTLDLVIDNALIKDENILYRSFSPELLMLAVPKNFTINETLKEFRLTAEDVKDGKHLTDIPTATLTDFAEESFVLLNPDNDTGKRARKLFKKHNIQPNIIFNLEQQVTAYNIAGSGMGIAFVGDTLIKHMDAEPPLYYYKLPDPETVRNVYFYTKNNHYVSLACQRFIRDNLSDTTLL